MSAPIDIRGILERAGADPQAPEGSQAWALAQVGEIVAELVDVATRIDSLWAKRKGNATGLHIAMYRKDGVPEQARAVLTRIGGAP